MKFIYGVLFVLVIAGCAKKDDGDAGGTTMTEPAQQIGDVMASVDEAGGSSGAIALQKSSERTVARFFPREPKENFVMKTFFPSAEATACNSTAGGFNAGYGACSTSTLTRNFAGCTGATTDWVFSGSVVFTWTRASGTGCGMGAIGDSVARSPSFTLTGRRNATLTVTKTGTYGQRLTWTSGTSPSKVYTLNSDGIQRKFTSGSTTLFDYTTSITSSVTVTGDLRLNRVMNGGHVQVVDNLAHVTCDYSPTNVTWGSATCNCPTSGSWQATCTDSTTATLVLSGCGTGTFTAGSDSGTVTFDRCAAN